MRSGCLLVLCLAPAWATTYYVDSLAGNDSNNGTSTATPWKTITKVNAGSYSAGDSILFQGGQTFSTGAPLYLTTGNQGTAAHPITISSYGTGVATINGGTGDAIFIYEVDGYTISGINVSGSGAGTNTGAGVDFYMDLASTNLTDGITITNVTASGFGEAGVRIGAFNGASGYSNITITYVTATNNGDNGIIIYGQPSATNAYFDHSTVYVGYCLVHDNAGRAGSSVPSGNGIDVSEVNTGTIEHNVVYSNGANNTNASGPVGVFVFESTAMTVQFNESYSNATNSGTDGDGFDFDGGTQNSVMQYNYSHDNQGAGFLIGTYSGSAANSGNTVRYNVSQNNGRSNQYGEIMVFAAMGAAVSGEEIYNNTLYDSGASPSSSGIYVLSATTNVHVRNNLIIGATGAGTFYLVNVAAGQTGILFQGNDYWVYGGGATDYSWSGTTYTSFSAWQTASSQEKLGGMNVGLTVDPSIESPGGGIALRNMTSLGAQTAYMIQPASAIATAGLNLNSQFSITIGSQDYWGAALPASGFSVGAGQQPCRASLRFGLSAPVRIGRCSGPQSGSGFVAWGG